MLRQVVSIVRGSVLRNRVFSLAKTCSIGLRYRIAADRFHRRRSPHRQEWRRPLADFEDAFARYLPAPPPGTATPQHSMETEA